METNPLYVDKSLFIEHFLLSPGRVRQICRQRRIGKSLNMDMLYRFLTDREDYRPLFENLAIRNSPVWPQANTSPVFRLDFKTLQKENYKSQILAQVQKALLPFIDDPQLPSRLKIFVDRIMQGTYPLAEALQMCTQVAYETTGKKAYILIDEYDSLLTYNDGSITDYTAIRDDLSKFFSSGMKGNEYLAKALLIGVSRVSHEGLISSLNNPTTYDVFRDEAFADDFGFTENEMQELSGLCGIDLDLARQWYNGIKIGGKAIYNTLGVMSMIENKETGCYWGETGSLQRIVSLLNGKRKSDILSLLEPNSTLSVPIEERVSPERMLRNCPDEYFYSYLLQTGYLALESNMVSIPNTELREVWERFILSQFLSDRLEMGSLLANLGNPEKLKEGLTQYLKKALIDLSFFEQPTIPNPDGLRRVPESKYHLLIYGLLKAGAERLGATSVKSNFEEGYGRYDISLITRYDEVRFEFKSAADGEDVGKKAEEALRQIVEKNYYADADPAKTLTLIGLGFYKKECAAAIAKLR